MRHSLFLVAIPLIALPCASAAQIPADSLVAGDHVRYELTSSFDHLPEKGEGTFEALGLTAVFLSAVDDTQSHTTFELPRELVDDFQVARGTENIGLPVAIIAGGVGCAIGFSLANNTGDQSGGIGACFAGTLVGGGIGFVVGSRISEPRWIDVDMD